MKTLEGRRIWSENGMFGLVIFEVKQLQVLTRPGHITGVMAEVAWWRIPLVVRRLRSLRGPGTCQLLILKSSRVVAPPGVQREAEPSARPESEEGLGAWCLTAGVGEGASQMVWVFTEHRHSLRCSIKCTNCNYSCLYFQVLYKSRTSTFSAPRRLLHAPFQLITPPLPSPWWFQSYILRNCCIIFTFKRLCQCFSLL